MKIKLFALVFSLSLLIAGLSACSFNALNSNGSVNTVAITNNNAVTEPTGVVTSGGAESQTPEALIADLYKQHDAKKSPFFQTKNRALVDKYFTKATADLIWKDATNSKEEIGGSRW